MINDVIERFRYRFELWRHGKSEDYLGPLSRADSSQERDYVSFYTVDPKRAELLRESTVKSVGRFFGAYFGVIVLASQILLLIGRVIPSARFALGIVFVVFAGLWTLIIISGEIQLRKARKQYREQQATKSSNQAMQLTDGRSESNVSVHESAFRPAMPRFRQR
jgi:uncharacterized membrane protein (DUF485 family)